MKLVVDELPYGKEHKEECPFAYGDSYGYGLCGYRNNEEKCPRYWDKHKQDSVDNPHKCERLIEFIQYLKEL